MLYICKEWIFLSKKKSMRYYEIVKSIIIWIKSNFLNKKLIFIECLFLLKV